jgi:hypothetical protein
MVVTKAEAQQLVNLLDVASNFLESAILSSLIPGTEESMREDSYHVKRDRRVWRRIEDWKIRLQAVE